jgi:methionyl-tRNA formyltransferase
LIPAPIKRAAEQAGIPVMQPESVNTPAAIEAIRAFKPELLLTIAYGQILKPDLLRSASAGGVNLHGSLLPRYRGAAPVARAILAGETETGVTVIQMSPRMDAGGILARAATAIGPDETTAQLEARLAVLGAPLVLDVLDRLESGSITPEPQDDQQATRAPKLTKADAPIDWGRSARAIHDQVRGLRPWPIAETTWHSAEGLRAPLRLLIHRTFVDAEPANELAVGTHAAPGTVLKASEGLIQVATGQGIVAILELQIPGKKPVSAAEFLRGYPIRPGDALR